jgi:transcriptional regulator with AAA-type ATPase domain/Tfp pilus assembly protein PilF
VPRDDQERITHLEERLAEPQQRGVRSGLAELEMLADLYLQADNYLPALEVIQRLLTSPEAREISFERRAALESKAIACRLAHGDASAALAQCRELLAREREIGSPSIRVRLHVQAAGALSHLARYEDAQASADRALALADACGDPGLQASALAESGRVAYRLGDLLRARDQYEQAFALYRRAGNEAQCAAMRNNLGLIHKNLCEWDAAVAHLRGALEIHRRLGRLTDSGNPLLNLGIVYQKQGDWARAIEHYQEAERVFLQVSDPAALARVSIGLGNVARLQRRYTESETLFLAALERSRGCDAGREEVLALEFLGELDFDRGVPERALARYHEALALAARLAPEGDLVVELERRKAEALAVLGRLDEADEANTRARRLARRIDDRLEHAVSYRVGGSIAMARGQRDEALQAWRTAVKLLGECRERYELGRTLLVLGRAAGDPIEARRLLYRASALFAELGADSLLEECERELVRVMAAPGPAPTPPSGSAIGRRLRAPSLVACSRAMQQAETLARRAASTDLSVLITGETGTGKELVARTIHSLSSRATRPFLAVNCGALRADLALSQLFGHRKGAFTGAHAEGVGLVEAAHGGTLFLDEVGELPLDVQVTLLRFLESGEYLRLGETQVRRADVRIIAATNRALRTTEGEKSFRRDLLFRLNEIEIPLPSLHERSEDVLPLARHFLAFYGGLEGPRLTGEAEAVLRSYPWPGNVRELENVMKRVAALHGSTESVDGTTLLPFLGGPVPMAAARERDERAALLEAVERARGNRSRAANLLGVSRKTFYQRVKRLGLDLG